MNSFPFLMTLFFLSCSLKIQTPDDWPTQATVSGKAGSVNTSICHLSKGNINTFDYNSITPRSVLADKSCIVSSMDLISSNIHSVEDSAALLILDKMSCYVSGYELKMCAGNVSYLFYQKCDVLIGYLSAHPNSCMRDVLVYGLKSDFLSADEILRQEVLVEIDRHVQTALSKKPYKALAESCWAALRQDIYLDDRISPDIEKRVEMMPE